MHFSLDGSGQGLLAIVNEDGSVNSPSNPAASGSIVTIYATGGGERDPAVADGQILSDVLPRTSFVKSTGERKHCAMPSRRRSIISIRAAVMAALTSATLLHPFVALAEPIPVRHMEGTVHGFLVLRTIDGKSIAAGDLTQVVRGNRLISNLIFHFRDGSVDDETTVFSQHPTFRLLSDQHVQKGPSFPHPMDVSIDAIKGDVTVRSWDGGKEKVETEHIDLPPDLANGLLLNLLKNVPIDGAETKVSYLVATPKPRLVKLAIKPQGKETFSAAGATHPLRGTT